MKKIISILLALSMLFSLNTVAFAAESGTTDELQIVEENGTRTVSLNDGELTYIVTYDKVSFPCFLCFAFCKPDKSRLFLPL